MPSAKAVARKAAEHGRHIFIYNNIRTNQVVYSLKRGIDNYSALSQLPYAGKKTVPASLRKDVWRPLATITFPSPPQGLSAYRQLREFRKLHEQNWDNNDEYPMLPLETQKKLKEGKSLPTKKDRGKIIMDQKANTVADLAAVLRIQNEQGARQAEERRKEEELQAEKERKHLEKLESFTKKVENGRLEQIKGELAEGSELLQHEAIGNQEKEALEKSLLGLKQEKNKINKAVHALREWKTGKKTLESSGPWPPPKHGKRRKEVLNPKSAKHIFTSNGVLIKWADILDAEYAESWPADVAHEALGLTKHSAPDPSFEPRSFPEELAEL